MKNLITLFLLVSTLALVSCGKTKENDVIKTEQTVEIETMCTETNESSESIDMSEFDALSEITVEKELFDVVLNIPKDFVGDMTQEDLNVICNNNGFKSITLNEDGTATYIMTKSQHKELMEEYRNQINASLKEMIDSEDYPTITDIQANKDFTEYTVTTKSEELDITERISVFGFYANTGLYGIFNGKTPDNVSVTFVNADSGNIIETFNSSDMAE